MPPRIDDVAEGVLVYETLSSQYSQLIWYNRRGEPLSTIGDPGLYFDVKLSPRGDQVAVTRQDPKSASFDIWLYDANRGNGRPFTSHPGNDRVPIWSPDGSRIVFGSNRNGTVALYEKPADRGTLPPSTEIGSEAPDRPNGTTWTSIRQDSLDWYAIHWPSGEKRAPYFPNGPCRNDTGVRSPANGSSHRSRFGAGLVP